MDITIKIVKGDPSTCKLTLEVGSADGGTVDAQPGDNVIWEIMPDSGVKQIINIIVDAGSNDVFNPDPAPVSGSTSWRGTINPGIDKFIEEEYTIEWTTTGSGWLNEGEGKVCAYDPLIRVNPK